MPGVYVYAIIPTQHELVFEAGGGDNDHDEVYTILKHDLAAVVSSSPLQDYRGLGRNEAVRYLVAHQRVVEVVMADFPLLPVKFGTVLPDEAWVRRLLEQGQTLFRNALDSLEGRVQMEVVVLWDLQKILQEIAQEEPIARLSAQLANRPAEDTRDERITIGQRVQDSLERRRVALQSHMLSSLREITSDLVINPPMDDSMVANTALLVDKAGREALDQRLELLDKEFDGQLRLRCVGPLPPYSFATVEVQVPSFQEILKARLQLGLGEAASTVEIRQAYRELASQLHPDHNSEDPQAEARMAALTRAYKLLTNYTENQATKAEGAIPIICRFDRETIEQTLLVTIRRQTMPAPVIL